MKRKQLEQTLNGMNLNKMDTKIIPKTKFK